MSKKEEIRQKITISALKRIENNPFFLNSFGIYFNFIYDNKKYFCRSFEELKVMYMLLKNNISFEYEKLKIKYLNDKNTNKTYISDFYINNTYYEIKSSLKNFFNLDRNKKYIYIQKMFKNKNIKFEITTPEILFKQLNLNINLEELYLFCKNLLENDLMNISFVTYTNNSRVLKKITSDYKNHKNIKIKFKRNENV